MAVYEVLEGQLGGEHHPATSHRGVSSELWPWSDAHEWVGKPQWLLRSLKHPWWNPTGLPLEPACARNNLGLRLKWSQGGRRIESKLFLVDAKIKVRGPVWSPQLNSVWLEATLPCSLALSVLRRIEPGDLELQGWGQFEAGNILKSDLIVTWSGPSATER